MSSTRIKSFRTLSAGLDQLLHQLCQLPLGAKGECFMLLSCWKHAMCPWTNNKNNHTRKQDCRKNDKRKGRMLGNQLNASQSFFCSDCNPSSRILTCGVVGFSRPSKKQQNYAKKNTGPNWWCFHYTIGGRSMTKNTQKMTMDSKNDKQITKTITPENKIAENWQEKRTHVGKPTKCLSKLLLHLLLWLQFFKLCPHLWCWKLFSTCLVLARGRGKKKNMQQNEEPRAQSNCVFTARLLKGLMLTLSKLGGLINWTLNQKT